LLTESFGANVADRLRMPRFSTASIDAYLVQTVTTMAASQFYHGYEADTMCGIPEIQITGTVEDWRLLRVFIRNLATLDPEVLKPWTDRMDAHLARFEAAVVTGGNITISETEDDAKSCEFWSSIFKYHSQSGDSEKWSGWITDFFLYLQSFKTGDLVLVPTDKKYMFRLVSIPSGMLECPFTLRDGSSDRSMILRAGFYPYPEQDATTGALQCRVGWAVLDVSSSSPSSSSSSLSISTSPSTPPPT
jgi:hypothetical protein